MVVAFSLEEFMIGYRRLPNDYGTEAKYEIVRDRDTLIRSKDIEIAESEAEAISAIQNEHPCRPYHTNLKFQCEGNNNFNLEYTPDSGRNLKEISVQNFERFVKPEDQSTIDCLNELGSLRVVCIDSNLLRELELIHKGLRYLVCKNGVLIDKENNTIRYNPEKCEELIKSSERGFNSRRKKEKAKQLEAQANRQREYVRYIDSPFTAMVDNVSRQSNNPAVKYFTSYSRYRTFDVITTDQHITDFYKEVYDIWVYFISIEDEGVTNRAMHYDTNLLKSRIADLKNIYPTVYNPEDPTVYNQLLDLIKGELALVEAYWAAPAEQQSEVQEQDNPEDNE